MHVLFPIGTFYPAQSGGPSNSVYWLAKALRQQGVAVTIVSTDTDQPDTTPRDQWLDTEAGRVFYARTPRHLLPIRAIRETLRLLPTADVVHLTSLFYTTSLVVGWMALRQGKRLVWSPRGELAAAARTYRAWPKQVVLNWLKQHARRITFHATSEAEAADIRAVFGPTSSVITLPNYLELASPLPRRQVRYLLYLGRLHPIKGLDNLLRAAAQSTCFRAEGWQLRLVGADADHYGQTLRELVAELDLTAFVQLEPPVAGVTKEELLADAHALLLPSHSENFGNVVVEALAQGTPVIASTGTPWQVLETYMAGLWVTNDPDSLAQAIDRFVSLPSNLYQCYRANALALARSAYDHQTNGHRWLAAYAALREGRPLDTLCAE